MVADAMRCLNQFLWPNGISANLSPDSIVTGIGAPDYKARDAHQVQGLRSCL